MQLKLGFEHRHLTAVISVCNCRTVLSQQLFLKKGGYLMGIPDQSVHSSVLGNMVVAQRVCTRVRT